jgi:two-component system, chemotaxis family, chemotaxis protein CheY
MRVLIADDQKNVGTTLASLVSHCNHQVVEVVGSGLEAIQAYARHNPDVVIMDYWMSKLNGATACRNILARDPTARVILVSAWAPLKELDDSGAVTVLSKPVDLEQLEAALNAAAAGALPHPEPWIMPAPDQETCTDVLPESGTEHRPQADSIFFESPGEALSRSFYAD